jgi:hypothetical protein
LSQGRPGIGNLTAANFGVLFNRFTATYREKTMSIEARLDKIESLLTSLVERQTLKDWYSTEEFAVLVGKAEFTVREWARLGRIHAEKRKSGRGAFASWAISHQEMLRYQREGLLPQPSRVI